MNGSRTGGSTPFPALTNTVTSLTGLPRKATIMAFDSLGVLLAVAYHDGKLCIYDMDELSFLYLRTKQQQQQQLQQQQQKEKQNGQVEEGDNTEQGKQEQQELEPQTNSTTTSTTPATLPPTTTILKPVLEVCLPFRYISFLQWNPFQQDILAVGNRYVIAILVPFIYFFLWAYHDPPNHSCQNIRNRKQRVEPNTNTQTNKKPYLTRLFLL